MCHRLYKGMGLKASTKRDPERSGNNFQTMKADVILLMRNSELRPHGKLLSCDPMKLLSCDPMHEKLLSCDPMRDIRLACFEHSFPTLIYLWILWRWLALLPKKTKRHKHPRTARNGVPNDSRLDGMPHLTGHNPTM